MTFFRFQQSAAIFLLGVTLSAASSPAQTGSTKTPSATPDTPPVAGKVVEDIVARVNDQIVTQSDYDRASAQLDADAKQQAVPAHELGQKQSDLLRDLIDQQLLLSKGKELGITGETELIKRLDELRKQNHLDSLEDLEKAYAAQSQGTTFEDFKQSIRTGIITQQVVRDEVGRHITLSPADAQRYYKQHESEFTQPESVTLNEILIPTPGKTATDPPDEAQVGAAQAQADGLVAKLAAGAKFDDLAKTAPANPSDPKNVPLGEFRRGMLAKEIEDKAFALNAGQYTQPIRTKQGFIILQVTQHTPGGAASFTQVEPQVEEALFMQQMQPKLREYLTKLREEAYVELKPGVVDTGASGNEMRLSYSAYTPPGPKKKKKFVRARFRGKTRSTPAVQTAASKAPPAPSKAATSAAAAANTQQASAADPGVQKPGKREKIRFGQAPRESLPPSSTQVASAAAPDNGPVTPAVTTPESRYINPDGTVTGEAPAAPERKTRLSNRPTVKKVKGAKSADAPPDPTVDELATQKVQDAPLGLDPTAAQKKAKQKATEKTRLADKPKQPDQTPAPYLGQPVPAGNQTATPDATQHPDPPKNPPAPATGPPDPIPPGGQQP